MRGASSSVATDPARRRPAESIAWRPRRAGRPAVRLPGHPRGRRQAADAGADAGRRPPHGPPRAADARDAAGALIGPRPSRLLMQEDARGETSHAPGMWTLNARCDRRSARRRWRGARPRRGGSDGSRRGVASPASEARRGGIPVNAGLNLIGIGLVVADSGRGHTRSLSTRSRRRCCSHRSRVAERHPKAEARGGLAPPAQESATASLCILPAPSVGIRRRDAG